MKLKIELRRLIFRARCRPARSKMEIYVSVMMASFSVVFKLWTNAYALS